MKVGVEVLILVLCAVAIVLTCAWLVSHLFFALVALTLAVAGWRGCVGRSRFVFLLGALLLPCSAYAADVVPGFSGITSTTGAVAVATATPGPLYYETLAGGGTSFERDGSKTAFAFARGQGLYDLPLYVSPWCRVDASAAKGSPTLTTPSTYQTLEATCGVDRQLTTLRSGSISIPLGVDAAYGYVVPVNNGAFAVPHNPQRIVGFLRLGSLKSGTWMLSGLGEDRAADHSVYCDANAGPGAARSCAADPVGPAKLHVVVALQFKVKGPAYLAADWSSSGRLRVETTLKGLGN